MSKNSATCCHQGEWVGGRNLIILELLFEIDWQIDFSVFRKVSLVVSFVIQCHSPSRSHESPSGFCSSHLQLFSFDASRS
jgi:hypothetical protein